MRKQQSGVMLLEALIAILIFSLGVLGLVGLQASTVNASRDARYRTDASLLANELIGQARVSDRNGPNLQTTFQSAQACAANSTVPYCVWAKRVVDTLPGALLPVVVVTPGTPTSLNGTPPQTSSLMNITVRWQAPNDVSEHRYAVVVQVI